MLLLTLAQSYADQDRELRLKTAIQDNGCAKPTKLEITPALYNT